MDSLCWFYLGAVEGFAMIEMECRFCHEKYNKADWLREARGGLEEA